MQQANPQIDIDDIDANTQYVTANGLRLAYDEFGNADDPPMVLIMGLGTQMIAWTIEFCEGLAANGYRVIRFDNRDIGLSEKIKVKRPMSIARIMLRSRLGISFPAPYDLSDMALDTVGLLDALNIDKAHLVGASMGGMIAQMVAAEHPKRCLSLTSIMSTTGNPALPGARWKVTKQLLNRPTSGKEADVIAHGLKTWAIIGSPDYPPTEEELRTKIATAFRRSQSPMGYRNQMVAIAKSGDRREALKNITAPTLVIHGKEDPLVPMEGGLDTAKCIKGAELKLIPGMGHDIPKEIRPRIIRLITKLANSAEG